MLGRSMGTEPNGIPLLKVSTSAEYRLSDIFERNPQLYTIQYFTHRVMEIDTLFHVNCFLSEKDYLSGAGTLFCYREQWTPTTPTKSKA
jgi:hypothetical protein